MRFMVIVKGDAATEAGVMPTEAELAAMGQFNEELVKAGIMLAGDGLHPSSKGARIHFANNVPTVVDGPFSESKELVAGYWIIQVKSKDDAIAWMSRAPMGNASIELRQLFELSDFVQGPAVAKHAELHERINQR